MSPLERLSLAPNKIKVLKFLEIKSSKWMNLKNRTGNETMIKWLFLAGRRDGSCPSQHTSLPTLICTYSWSWCPLIENDQNQPLVNTGRKNIYWKDLGHFKEPNQRPNNPASERAWIRTALRIEVAGIERDVNLRVLTQASNSREKRWASPSFCTSNRGGQSPLISRRPHQLHQEMRNHHPKSSKDAVGKTW